MLEVSGKPILEHIIDVQNLKGLKILYYLLIILGEMIENYFGTEKLGVNIEYVREKKPLGTAGSLSLLES